MAPAHPLTPSLSVGEGLRAVPHPPVHAPAPAPGLPAHPWDPPLELNPNPNPPAGSPKDAAKVMWLMYEQPDIQFEGLAMRFMDIRWADSPTHPPATRCARHVCPARARLALSVLSREHNADLSQRCLC